VGELRTVKQKLVAILIVLGIAALCPAPINSIIAKGKFLRTHSEAERTEELKYNGTTPVVGGVPMKTNEDGDGPAPVVNDEQAAKSIVADTPIRSNPRAVASLKRASVRVKQAEEGSGFSWLTALLVFALGFGVFQGFRFWSEKAGPAPKRLK